MALPSHNRWPESFMPNGSILMELNALVRDQLSAFDEVRFRSFSRVEAEQYAWRNEQIRMLLEQLELEATTIEKRNLSGSPKSEVVL